MSSTMVVKLGEETWPLAVRVDGPLRYMVTARSTEYTVYVIPQADGNLLVSVLELNRCGSVPPDATARDVTTYCGIHSRVDAANIAAALRLIQLLRRRESE